MTSRQAGLAKEHQKLLETIYDALRNQGKWPSYEYLERVLHHKFGLEIEAIGKTLPAHLTRLPRPPYPVSAQQPIEITVEGLVYCPGADDDLKLFFRVFQRFVELDKALVPDSVDATVRPCLNTDDLSREWGTNKADLNRVFQIVALEPWVSGVTGGENTTKICAGPIIWRFDQAQVLDQYVGLRRAWLAPRVAGAEFRGPGDPGTYKRIPVSSGGDLPRQADKDFDAFIAHASADKDSFVRPLAAALQSAGLMIWFDEFELTVGDSLRRKIEDGLRRSRYGIVVLSPDFFEREWPQTELDGLAQKEVDGRKVILPVRHRITPEQIRARSPMLAGRVSVSSETGIDYVVKELLRAMGQPATPETRNPGRGDQMGDVASLHTTGQPAAPETMNLSPVEEYHNVERLLRQHDIAAAKKRARILGSQLRTAVTEWLEAKPVLPSTVSPEPKLESWEPIYKPLLVPIGDRLRNFAAAATAAVELDGDVLVSFVNELVLLFRAGGTSAGPEGGAPELVARLEAEILFGRALALGRWRALIDIARPKVNYGTKVDNWVFLNSFIHPRFFGGNGYWPGLLGMDLLRADAINGELGLGAEEAGAAAAEASMLLGIVDYSKKQRQGRDMPFAWGFAGTGPREVVHKALTHDELVVLLADFAGEPVDQFRERFSQRFKEMFKFAHRGNWTVGLLDETVALLDEISGASKR